MNKSFEDQLECLVKSWRERAKNQHEEAMRIGFHPFADPMRATYHAYSRAADELELILCTYKKKI